MGDSSVRIMLAGGGTAGHVNPLLAVADALVDQQPQADIIALGTAVGLESHLVPDAGYTLKTIEKVPFPRKPNMQALRFPGQWKREKAKVRHYLQEQQTQVVVGFGGYASAPAYAAAHSLGIPIVIHEQNAKAGMANKLGSKWASFIGTAYDNTGLRAPSTRVGLPLRPAIAQLASRLEQDKAQVRRESAQALGLDPQRPIIVVTGGSLGAKSINDAVSASAPELLRYAQIVHLTGNGKLDDVVQTVTRNAGEQTVSGLREESVPGHDYHAAAYLERIDQAFGCADLVICRSGAGTVSELTALGIPAIYVPLPIGNGEQRFNAQPVVEAGGGIMVADHEFTDAWISSHVPQLLESTSTLETYGQQAWKYGIRDAAHTMAQEVLRIASAQ